jgi:hypothetical protein
MRLTDLVDELGLRIRVAGNTLDAEVTGGYASDLISDVLAHGRSGDLWVTLQTHQNIVAVASLKELAGIVLVGGREPQEETLRKAEEEGVSILVSELTAFELVGRLYGLGLRSAVLERAGA